MPQRGCEGRVVVWRQKRWGRTLTLIGVNVPTRHQTVWIHLLQLCSCPAFTTTARSALTQLTDLGHDLDV